MNAVDRQTCREALVAIADMGVTSEYKRKIDAALAALDEPPQSFPVEVQPPAHVLDMLLAEMEGDYCLDTLRFVIYNDAERDEWLRPQPPAVPPDVREATVLSRETVTQARLALEHVRCDIFLNFPHDWQAERSAPILAALKEFDAYAAWLDAHAQEGHCVPDWSNAPEWARWWAVDPYGESMWYEEEPLRYETVTFCGWGPKVEYGLEIGMKMGANVVEIPLGIDWRMLKFRRTWEMAK